MERFWRWFFPAFYRALRVMDPLIERAWRRFGLGNVVMLTTIGRRTGAPRSTFVGVLRVGGREYLGHPNGRAAWVSNLLASPQAAFATSDGTNHPFLAVPLPDGAERFAAIDAAFRQHPFPGGVIYWLARRHVRRAGTYFRLEPVDAGESSSRFPLSAGTEGTSPAPDRWATVGPAS